MVSKKSRVRIPVGLRLFILLAAVPAAGVPVAGRERDPFREAVDRTRTKVVVLKTQREPRRGFGTGFLARPGLVVTAGHVVEGTTQITAWVNGVDYGAEVLDSPREHDLAILGLRAPDLLLKPAVLAMSSAELQEGEELVIVAGPAQSPAAKGDPAERLARSATFRRRVRLRDGAGRLAPLLEMVVHVDRGDSGSPVVRVRDGAVVGIVSSREAPDGEGNSRMAYAVPIEALAGSLDAAGRKRQARDGEFYLFQVK